MQVPPEDDLEVLADGSIVFKTLKRPRYTRLSENWPDENDLDVFSSASMDSRTPTERDRGRIIYSTYLPRLAGVTQVVSPTLRHGSMHSRLTHSHKVATLSREIANDIARTALRNGFADRTNEPSDALAQITALDIATAGGLDIAACELAGLAHDIGHAPFGHAAEKFMDAWLLEVEAGGDGFEGNAQTTRVLSRLDPHVILGKNGLNLTAVSIGAVQKYPWLRDHDLPLRASKFSVYSDDSRNLEFARSAVGDSLPADSPSLEASIMDVADDITYAIHDLQDFYQAGLINIQQVCDDLKRDAADLNNGIALSGVLGIFTSAAAELETKYPTRYRNESYAAAMMRVRLWLLQSFPGPFDGSTLMQANVRQVFSQKIKDILAGLRLSRDLSKDPFVHFGGTDWHEVQVLKQIAQGRVVSTPSVALHERSQLAALKIVVEALEAWCTEGRAASLPHPLATYVLDVDTPTVGTIALRRAIVDFVCSMTDEGCAQLARNLGGFDVAWSGVNRA